MTLRQKTYRIIFYSDTPAGRLFDIVLLWMIAVSVVLVVLDSVQSYAAAWGNWFFALELTLTLLFTIEYLVRIWCSPKRLRYVFSFWGVIDLLAIMPTYLSLIYSGYQYLLIVRVFRLLRVFRILRLAQFSTEARIIVSALQASRYKITVFLLTVLSIATLMGTVMYVFEGGEKGFTDIPQSIYWAIVTITTVGYGDMVPSTVIGKIISSFAMLLGYAIIAVPTGIVTAELVRSSQSGKKCKLCEHPMGQDDLYCSRCGEKYSEKDHQDQEKEA